MLSQTNKHIVITGATGFIGSTLLLHFSQLNYALTALVRAIPKNSIPNVDYVIYNLEQSDTLNVFKPNSILIHAAYSKTPLIVNGEDINVIATRRLLDEAKINGVKQCVFISSISVLSKANTYYANQKRKLEELFNTEHDCIIRPGLVIGNGGLFYNSLYQLKKIKILPLINNGLQPVYYTGINDVINLIESVITSESTGITHLVNPTSITYKEFYASIAKQLGFRITLIPVPLWLLKFMVWLFSFSKNPPLTNDNLIGLMETHSINLSNIKSSPTSDLKNILEGIKI